MDELILRLKEIINNDNYKTIIDIVQNIKTCQHFNTAPKIYSLKELTSEERSEFAKIIQYQEKEKQSNPPLYGNKLNQWYNDLFDLENYEPTLEKKQNHIVNNNLEELALLKAQLKNISDFLPDDNYLETNQKNIEVITKKLDAIINNLESNNNSANHIDINSIQSIIAEKFSNISAQLQDDINHELTSKTQILINEIDSIIEKIQSINVTSNIPNELEELYNEHLNNIKQKSEQFAQDLNNKVESSVNITIHKLVTDLTINTEKQIQQVSKEFTERTNAITKSMNEQATLFHKKFVYGVGIICGCVLFSGFLSHMLVSSFLAQNQARNTVQGFVDYVQPKNKK